MRMYNTMLIVVQLLIVNVKSSGYLSVDLSVLIVQLESAWNS